MYTTINGKSVKVYEDTGVQVRQFHARADVLQATVSGNTVAIVTSDGYTLLYDLNGSLIRQTKAR